MEAWKNPQLPIEQRINDLVGRMTLQEKASQLLHSSPAIERLGIPAYNWWNEALHGIARAGKATVFPQAIGLAASFDPELLQRIAQAIADEGRAKHHAAASRNERGQYRGLTFWTPNVNIFRDPRWGRGQETYGEDPYLSGCMGLAMVRGLQQQRNGILKSAACAKHFAVHSGPEALRHEFNAVVTAQDLRETYLPAFKTLVTEGQVEAVMGAYNRTNGEVCCGSKTLLHDILRNEWGFDGHVVSDCWAVRDFHQNHHVTDTPEQSVALAIKSGCDLNCGCTYGYALQAIEQGLLDESDINQALGRILAARFRLGLLDGPDQNPWKNIPSSCIDSPTHRSLALEAAQASFVLLKNNGVLPLPSSIGSIYVIGPNASNPQALYGNYYGLNGTMVTFLEGILQALPEGARIDYRPGTLIVGTKPNPVDWAVGESEQAEVTIACFGLDNSLEGEEGDAIASPLRGDREAIELPDGQLEYLKKLRSRCRKLVVVLFTGAALAIPEVHEMADAILVAWYPGEEGGTALANVLFGKTNPCGSLPVTWYRRTKDLPDYEDYSMRGRTYRYLETLPLYPFGFGLSYTTFAISHPIVTTHDEQGEFWVDISVEVKNSGAVEGAVAIQVYLSPPKLEANLPLWSLKAFAKTPMGPGSMQRMCFNLGEDAFTVYDDQGKPYIPNGTWTISIGNCSPSPVALPLGASPPCTLNVYIGVS